MIDDSTPAEEMPAVRPSGGHGSDGAVPELNPEGLAAEDDTEIDSTRSAETESSTREDDSFVSPAGDLQHADEVFDIPTDTARGFDTALEDDTDDTDEPDDTDRPGSDRQDQTSAPTRRTQAETATELEPESSTELTTTRSKSTENPSLYPGKLPSVRAPGWDQSASMNRRDVEDRREVERPHSAPSLEPASAPSLASFGGESHRSEHSEDTPAMAPVEETSPNTAVRRHYTAVDQAAKELARAALQAEIEKEEKQALRGYEPEEGEIPPSPEVAKRFDVILQLGKGGMAVVYLCRDPRRRGRVFAVKDIRAEMKPGMNVEQRVEHEAMLLKELDHPGIVKVYDFLKFPRGSAIVMEFIDGLPLDHEIGASRRITWDFGARILREIGSALHYAHGKGVIHRDIKPDNILFSERHSIMKLVDFGLARMFGDQTEVHMTRTGMVVGTPHYMSPEQVSGKALDQRSDVYSFGATLYYLLTGQRHVEGSNIMDILEQQRSKEILPPSHLQRDIPAWLSYIIGKMMEIKADDRYQTMQEVLDDLDIAEADPEHFVRNNPRGQVKRYAGADLAPYVPETDSYTGGEEAPDGWPSSQAPAVSERTTNRVSRRSKRVVVARDSSDSVVVLPEITEVDQATTPAQMSAMLREISARLEKTEKRMVGPGLLVLIVLLSVLIVMLAIAGGLLLAQREGYLQQFLGW